MLRPRFTRYAGLLALAGNLAVCQQPRDTIAIEWDFQAGTTLGWTASPGAALLGNSGGALQAKAGATGALLYSPWFELRAAALQRVEIRMRSDTNASTRWFWAPAREGQYGGFQPGKERSFPLIGDNEFRTYAFGLTWSPAIDPVIYRFRVDVPAGATVAISLFRVTTLAEASGPARVPRWEFNSDGDTEGWRVLDGMAEVAAAGGRLTVRTSQPSLLLAPKSPLDPRKVEWVTIRARVVASAPEQSWMSAWWTTSASSDPAKRSFGLIPDGQFHLYNLNVGGVGSWWATPVRFGLRLPANEEVEIDWIHVGGTPDGEGEPGIQMLAPERAVNGPGRVFRVICDVVNRGGTPLAGARARIVLPEDGSLHLAKEPPPLQTLVIGEPQRLVWELIAEQSFDAAIAVEVTAPGAIAAQAATTLPITPSRDLAAADYVPEPAPLDTGYDIGAYYYPGWYDYFRWEPVRRFPERTPVLGFYKEGDPQVADWHIKWAVEHGVKFFVFDWYWLNGKEALNHAYPAFAKARYSAYLKYCLLYANHSPFNIHSRAELMAITRFWLDTHFSRDTFYAIGGKPVVIIFAPSGFRQVLGSPPEIRAALEESRQIARDRGLPGIYYVACSGNSADAARLSDEGYDAATAYNNPGAGAAGDNRAPYSAMVDAFGRMWDGFFAADKLPYIVPVSPGWDPRPWHGDDTLVRPGNTVAEFRRMLQMAKDRIDDNAGPRVLLIEAWNEWGEGSILEPQARDGFGALDAVRDVFAPGADPHLDVSPDDVGLPLVEWPPPSSVTSWAFRSPEDIERWSTGGLENLRIESGRLLLRTAAGAWLVSPEFRARARNWSQVIIRMRASVDTSANFYWDTVDAPGMSAFRSAGFAVQGGEMRSYVINLSDHPGWRGYLAHVRLSPASQAGVDIEVESIALAQ